MAALPVGGGVMSLTLTGVPWPTGDGRLLVARGSRTARAALPVRIERAARAPTDVRRYRGRPLGGSS